jgi:hypothetical protein
VADTDRRIDDLFQLSPAEFTSARNALAKTLTGDAARRVKALKKPSAVAWAVNQVFWKARPAWDALMTTGHTLRTAQIAALKGKKSDVRAATGKHRHAVAAAVTRAQQLAAAAGVNPNTDHLARMLEALSLSAGPAEEPGRFTDVVQPSGFDALAGVKPVTPPPSSRDQAKKQKEQDAEKQRRLADARLETATTALAHARDKADAARRALNRADADVADARREVEAAQAEVTKREP